MFLTYSQAKIVSEELLVPRANRLVIKKNNQRVASDSHITDTMLRFGIVHSANLDFASLIWDEFYWQAVERSSKPSKMSKLLYTHFTKLIIDSLLSLNKSIPRRSDSKFHSSHDNHPITKILSTTNSEYKFGMEVSDAMISDAIKKKVRYKYYMAKKVESEKAKIIEEPEEQHISPIKSGRGKGFMCYGDQVANAPNKIMKDLVPRKTRSLTEEAVVVKGEGLSAVHKKYYSSSETNSDATLYSSTSDKSEENANETDDADESEMDLSDDNPDGDDDDDA
ncbi:hypothetical protein Tco_1082762, partial [Tanacetum coccineum]